jgi:hypothetical protein
MTFQVITGSQNTSFQHESTLVQQRKSESVLVHPSYNGSWAKDDIALVKVNERTFSTTKTFTLECRSLQNIRNCTFYDDDRLHN